MITADRLREVIIYDPDSGIFSWKIDRGSRFRAGSIAGSIDHKGYHNIRIGDKIYRSARLAVLYMTDNWPVAEVDHENCIRSDNRWCNLRDANRSQNMSNRRARNSTGFKGVCLHRKTGLYRAEIRQNGKCKSLGYYKSPEAAHAAYVVAAKVIHGEFFRAA